MTTPSSPRPTITLDAANSYFQTRTRAEAWFQAPDATRAAALETASRILGRAYRFTSDARYVDANGADAWREEILDALCEEAYWLMRYDADSNAELVARGVRRAALGARRSPGSRQVSIPRCVRQCFANSRVGTSANSAFSSIPTSRSAR